MQHLYSKIDNVGKYLMYNYWGKADKDNNYHLLVYHCLDVAAVGSVLYEYNIEFFQDLSRRTDVSVKSFKNLFLFFLALHDIGKFSISFQNLRSDLLKTLQNKTSCIEYNSAKYRHDKMGFLLYDKRLKDLLKTELKNLFGFIDKDVFYGFISPLISVVMGHHGKPVSGSSSGMDKVFESEDYKACEDFVKELIQLFLNQEVIDELNTAIETLGNLPDETDMEDIMKPLTWQLAGFTVICDWIASGDGFKMRSQRIPLPEYWEQSKILAEKSIHNKGVLKASIPVTNSFENLFPQYAESPTPLQNFCNTVKIPDEPQMWILEDVTGAGKTEAALTLTSRIMAKKLGDGCFIALPTMATSNSMYSRMSEVYNKLFCKGETPSLILSHGSRHMDKKFRESYSENIIISENDGQNIENDNFSESGKAYCAKWLSDSSKKSLLSDIGVGTIDQLLLGVLPVRYQSLRYWGMGRKVLIIDEVHACDTYMARLLEKVIEGHAAAGGSIILMTATLPIHIRKMYMVAFLKGFKEMEYFLDVNENDFPLITGVTKDGIFTEEKLETRKELEREITVKFCENPDSVYSVIEEYIKKGQCVCWMRNTIKDVLESYNTLLERNITEKGKLGVYHSRYTLYDRQIKEALIIKKFGVGSTNEDRDGQVIISSQILQESIDVDFDLIISDLAPMDMLIQRLGRMHRHNRGSNRDSPVFYLHLPPASDTPESTWYSDYFEGASYVYKNTGVLWNTRKLLKEKQSITMPDDLRYLIEGVFGGDDFDVPEVFFDSVIESSGEDNAKKSIGDLNCLKLKSGYTTNSSSNWYEEENISTRLGDEQVTLYLCRFNNCGLEPLYNDVSFPWEMSSLKIRATMLKELAYSLDINRAIEDLKNGGKRKFHSSSIFVVVENSNNEIDITVTQVDGKGIKIKYSEDFGLEIVR